MKKGHDLKIREKLSKSYMHVIFIASISAIVDSPREISGRR